MIILLLVFLFLLCYFYIRYTEAKSQDLNADSKVCDAIGKLVAFMIFADDKREFKEYEVATYAINYRFKIAVSDKVKTSVLEYYNKQEGVDLNEGQLAKTSLLIAEITEQLKELPETDRVAVMEVLCRVARVSGFKMKEWQLFQIIGVKLSISAKDMDRYRLFFEPHIQHSEKTESLADSYAVLGLSTDATQQQIEDAYLELLQKYQPDAVADDTLRPVFEEKRKEIEEAYNKLIKA